MNLNWFRNLHTNTISLFLMSNTGRYTVEKQSGPLYLLLMF